MQSKTLILLCQILFYIINLDVFIKFGLIEYIFSHMFIVTTCVFFIQVQSRRSMVIYKKKEKMKA